MQLMALQKLYRISARLAAILVLGALQACGSVPNSSPVISSAPNALWQPEDQLKWEAVPIPGKVATQYSVVR